MYLVRIALVSALYNSSAQASNNTSNLTIALLRVPPPQGPLPIYEYDKGLIRPHLTSSVDAGIENIKEAKTNGANWLLFPELWLPKGSDHNNWTSTHLPAYIDHAMVKGCPEWNRLNSGIQDAGTYAGLSFAEKLGDNFFMALALISPNRDELISHHKLRPSGAERDIFSDGTIDQLNVVTSAYGRAGFLECGEHQYPSITFDMQAQAENFHLGPFPYMSDVGDDKYFWREGALANTGTMGHSAILGGSYSFTAAVGYSFAVDLWLRLPHPLLPTVASSSVLFSTTVWK